MSYIPAVPEIKTDQDYQKALEKSQRGYQLPKSVASLYHVHYFRDQKDVLEMKPAIENSEDQVIFYVHGGGYWGQPTMAHFNAIHRLAKQLGSRVIMPIYPKAPAYEANDAYEMVLKSYLSLLNDEQIDITRITVMGDSAGAGLILALLQRLRDNHLPLPHQAFLLSPWLDITNSNPKMTEIQPLDPMLDLPNLTLLGKYYAGDLNPKDSLVSPIYGNSAKLPPIYVFTGDHDILNADAMKFQQMADEKDWQVTTFKYHAMNHVFSIFPTPEGRDSLDRMTQIIQLNG
ncbi:alpha/beta hydrolase fold domain-containing protein [Lentilactobacillus hilgardii]|uniref:alpha/beta hydrolase fold domain-containing protein n=1 Tax=Lentilactobacillus hilgardii TaxID=1588 RepID=UPI0021A78EA1|nr:alpha/beta hydrolase [Lentilactobacillus hilgardii]MCT3398507.1 alpha/beta hydrolase [Lentilactobacillus hilgardii]